MTTSYIGDRTIRTKFFFGRRLTIHHASDVYMLVPILAMIFTPLVAYYWVLYTQTVPTPTLQYLFLLLIVNAVVVEYNHMRVMFTNPGVLVPDSPFLDPEQGTWCNTCKLHRPVRASHCGRCDVCVLEYDHHCGVLGCCVGQFNLRYFVGFLFWTALLGCTLLTNIVYVQLHGEAMPGSTASFRGACSVILGIICLYVGLGLGFVSLYYFWLIYSNRTYKEEAKNKPLLSVGGSSLGCGGVAGHCYRVLCAPQPKDSLIIV
eukprot:PhF_6_TR8510/c0_g1_i1/m.13317/K16675/ZDHHC9_14_18; palmitoyltransferase ZDHHC9/14/18